jgi:hypothetical protein
MGVDDDLCPAQDAHHVFSEPEQNGAVALALQVVADADQAQPRLRRVDEVDAHRTHDLAVTGQHVGEVAGLELVGIAFVVGLSRQQGRKNRIAADRVIGDPLPWRLHGP